MGEEGDVPPADGGGGLEADVRLLRELVLGAVRGAHVHVPVRDQKGKLRRPCNDKSINRLQESAKRLFEPIMAFSVGIAQGTEQDLSGRQRHS